MQRKSRAIRVRISLLFLVAFIMSASLAFGYSVSAADPGCPEAKPIRLQVPIPGLKGNCVSGFPEYIRVFYNFFVGSVGIIAVVMVMIGGFQWIVAAGNSQRIDEAKSTIFSALAGLVIALGSYVILNVINPRLTRLEIPNLPSIEQKYVKQVCETVKDNASYECGKYYQYDAKTNSFKLSTKTKEDLNAGICMGTFCGGPYPKPDAIDPNYIWKAPVPSGCNVGGGIALSQNYECLVAKCPPLNTSGLGCEDYGPGGLIMLRHNQGDRTAACNWNLCNLPGLLGKGCVWSGAVNTGGCINKQ